MARGYYDRHLRDAAVTKLVARPMLSVFFPELTNVEQPPERRDMCRYKSRERV
jgi:hypothetical protein